MASTLSLSLIILFSPIFITSSNSQYTLPDHYFINCGSTSAAEFTGQTFTGDNNPTNFSVSGGTATADRSPASNSPVIYQSARVFTQKSWYELEADQNNTFVMVRLHFSPFNFNQIELSSSKFEVSASGFPLLSNFNANTTVIKDFIIPIGSLRTFRIEFTPSRGSSSPAFINAIEAFTTPSELFRHGVGVPRISPTGNNGDMNNISTSYAFIPNYRINVGGQRIEVDRDTLRRIWIPDDPYIFRSEPARNRTYGGTPMYNSLGSNRFDAPNDVYTTAKELTNNLVNLTWSFEVKMNAMYLVRAHFCDFISPGLVDKYAGFNFFVYSQYPEKIIPAQMQATQVPFYVDFVVSSVGSTFVNFSIGAISGDNQTAFLNGLEIMELLENSTAGGLVNNGKKSNKVYIVVGGVVGGVVLVLVLLVGFFIGSKYAKSKPVVEAKPGTTVGPSHGGSSYSSINIDFTINHPSPLPNLNLSLRFPFADILQATNALDNTLPQKEVNLADWAIKHIKDGKAEAIMDPYLVGTINPNSLRKFLETVERCLKDTGDERPSMIDVLWDLEYALKLQQMFVDKEPYEDTTMDTSLQLPMSMIQHLPSNTDAFDSEVNDLSMGTDYPSESQVFSQLKMDEAR
ncbi:hypothetical protein E3N88_43710 [Mikania micrantha]|uniref:Malectin-like domain-containing protein n=1 Tax=Mikania micrantha TaxID=192012 RepID=A0A5N6LGD3_9ASTR|nr:hypothetical protein E3N88_43710 [Mikania micrantha]